MAKLAKQLYIVNSSGVQQNCGIYGTTSEAGSNYMYATVDGQTAYIPLVSTSSALASSGRVLKSGTTYAIGKAGIAPYNYQTITTVGSGTFTVPADVYRLKVTCVGGGAGGMLLNTSASCPTDNYSNFQAYNGDNTWRYHPSIAGGNTSFGSVSAQGGTAPIFNYVTCSYQSCSGSGDNCQSCSSKSGYRIASCTVSQGRTNGQYWSSTGDYHGRVAGYYPTTTSGVTISNETLAQNGWGTGGLTDGQGEAATTGASGRVTITTISVTPGQKISYCVGNYGSAWRETYLTTTRSSSSGGRNAGRGEQGLILVEWGGSIV